MSERMNTNFKFGEGDIPMIQNFIFDCWIIILLKWWDLMFKVNYD